MLTPYDWQEGIGHRARYIESRLLHGTPVLAVSLEAGVLFFTYRRQARKLYEVYDQLAMAAIGQQSDVEGMRMASVDFAHQEGYNRSETDVTIQRVVTAISTPIKRAFADFQSAPVIARALFAEVGETPAQDRFVMMDYDGDYHARRNFGYLVPTDDMVKGVEEKLSNLYLATANIQTAIEELESIWNEAIENTESKNPLSEELNKEIAILERGKSVGRRFRYITDMPE